MGANDANLEISYHHEQGAWVILSWHHGEHKIDAKADLTPAQWQNLKGVARSGASALAIGRHVAELLGVRTPPLGALAALGQRMRELLG